MNRTPQDASGFPPLGDRRLHDPARPEPVSHIFTIIPDVDTESLLCHACETLASLKVMTAELAGDLQGPHRHVVLALQQLTELGELLVSRALDNLGPCAGSPHLR